MGNLLPKEREGRTGSCMSSFFFQIYQSDTSLHLPWEGVCEGMEGVQEGCTSRAPPHGRMHIRCTFLRCERRVWSVSPAVSWQTWSWRHWTFVLLSAEVPVPRHQLPGYREAGSGASIFAQADQAGTVWPWKWFPDP